MQRLILVIGILALVVAAVLYVKSAGLVPKVGTKKNNLVDEQCLLKSEGTSYPGHTDIPVNSQDGISYDNEAIFVCPGEKVRWVAGSGVTSIDVYFASATEWPFTDPFTSPLSMTGNHTMDQTVGPIDPKFRIRPFKYRIHVGTPGAPIPDLDPHIIPMGP
jgi:hypothetical protein